MYACEARKIEARRILSRQVGVRMHVFRWQKFKSAGLSRPRALHHCRLGTRHQESGWLETKNTSLQLVARTGSDRFRVGENTPAVPVGDKPHWGLRRGPLGCHELDVAALLIFSCGEHNVLHHVVPVGHQMLEAGTSN